ncbi:MAG: hypothetical protein Q8Q04_00900 [archaeon]|nr:hypothetical protein [archaeon]
MGKLYLPKYLGSKDAGRGIVEVLTDDKERTSVWTTDLKGIREHKVIGINSVSEDGPVRFCKYFERGFVNPENGDILYLIDGLPKKVHIVLRNFNLFYDLDKASANKFIWTGNFQEIINEFKNYGYSFLKSY